MIDKNSPAKPLWKSPLGLAEAFTLAAGLLTTSFLMYVVSPNKNVISPAWPLNLWVLIGLVVFCFVFPLLFRKSSAVKWLGSGSVALAALSLFALVVLVMALIPQGVVMDNKSDVSALGNIKHTWPFIISCLFLLVSLGFATVRRLFPLEKHSIAFFLNHVGLWIVLAAGVMGHADRREYKMTVLENELVWFAANDKGLMEELPLAIRLKQFILEQYAPKIAITDPDGKPYRMGNDQLRAVDELKVRSIDDYNITVLEYLPKGFAVGNQYIYAPGVPGAAPAALLKVTHHGVLIDTAWVGCGSQVQPPLAIQLAMDTLLVLLPPEPKRYASNIVLYTKSGVNGEAHLIEVNKPLQAEGFSIYQYSYDYDTNRNVYQSVFLLVHDPWLPIVYVGMAMLLAGALWLVVSKRTFSHLKKKEAL